MERMQFAEAREGSNSGGASQRVYLRRSPKNRRQVTMMSEEGGEDRGLKSDVVRSDPS